MTKLMDDLKFNRITKQGLRNYLSEYANGPIVGEETYIGS